MKVNMDLLRSDLTRDEGKRQFPYKDTKGKLTIGIGHNLTDLGLTEGAIQYIFNEDIATHMAELEKAFPWVNGLPEVAQRVLVNMAFNMGIPTLRTFKHTLAAFQRQDWPKAAAGMEDSLWARQVGQRADRLIAMIRGLDQSTETHRQDMPPTPVAKPNKPKANKGLEAEKIGKNIGNSTTRQSVPPQEEPDIDWKGKLWDLLQHLSQS